MPWFIPWPTHALKKVLRCDGSAAGGRSPYRQVLLEDRGAYDEGLVNLLMLVDAAHAESTRFPGQLGPVPGKSTEARVEYAL
jgi:hypothetical protein